MVYFFARILAYIILMPVFFVKVVHKENLRIHGGCVVICNHISNWDPIVLGHSVKTQPVCYMAKEELFRNRMANWFLRRLHAIPVARGKSDLKAVKTGLSALKSGKILGIFPEGHRSETGELLPFEPGAALMALRADVPVVPVYISGNYKPFRQVKLYTHPAIRLKDVVGEKTNSAAIEKATEYLKTVMLELEEQACQK
ncbi:lysophospholipid acyltransferase family protein [Christensenella tenuis]|uniref:1-acyl-sn-glycerol-3-phosphate acyltransferase n=1 Tax=Christensenella tenuis TaxID=2763033 RepID=A0ABR7EBI6_9FIRM|nr:lysophospholipid acyltransferase family protein [Christensenella tenuis]MBC5647148.1 1-acyl-sn-glycerol-3-phosphate acyltransferase [Christensenella tenuis]